MSGKKPAEPDLAALVNQVKAELRADLGKALEHGARAWAAQSNQVFESVSARLSRLEQRASPPNRKR
jgi:hypothetical protein